MYSETESLELGLQALVLPFSPQTSQPPQSLSLRLVATLNKRAEQEGKQAPRLEDWC